MRAAVEDDVADEAARLLEHRRAQLGVELGNSGGFLCALAVRSRRRATARAKVATMRARAGREQAPGLLLDARGVRELAGLRGGEQRVVRHRAPEAVRERGRDLVRGERERAVRRPARRARER